MTMKNITKTTKTTIVLSVMFAVAAGFTMTPSVNADAGGTLTAWWQSDPEMCYSESSLNNLNFEDSTGNGADVITQMELSRVLLNGEMNGITIKAQGLFSCLSWVKHIDVQSEDIATATWLAYERSIADDNDATDKTQSEIRFDTKDGWGENSDTCNAGDVDVEWVMNHELGHGIGLDHHDHNPDTSMMDPVCGPIYSTLQTVDDTAIDIHYQ